MRCHFLLVLLQSNIMWLTVYLHTLFQAENEALEVKLKHARLVDEKKETVQSTTLAVSFPKIPTWEKLLKNFTLTDVLPLTLELINVQHIKHKFFLVVCLCYFCKLYIQLPFPFLSQFVCIFFRSQVEIEIKKRMKAEATQDHLVRIKTYITLTSRLLPNRSPEAGFKLYGKSRT